MGLAGRKVFREARLLAKRYAGAHLLSVTTLPVGNRLRSGHDLLHPNRRQK